MSAGAAGEPVVFGTPSYLERERGDVAPVVDGVERTTTWQHPDRAAVVGSMADRDPGRVYPRYGHPNSMLLEAWVARLEGAEGCVSFSSGMAAISALPMALLRQGDTWAYASACYGGTHAFAGELERFGIDVIRFDAGDDAAIERVLAAGAKLVHVESPINPTARILDLEAIAQRVHAGGALLSCDATFLPPPLLRSLELGVDLAVHSATKYLGGHSDVLAGVVSGSRELMKQIERWRRVQGAVLGPDDAWLLRRSLETVELRTRVQSATAQRLAEWLSKSDKVARVHYPALPGHADHALLAQQSGLAGGVFAFEPAGGEAETTHIFNALRVFRRAVSLGGVESLVSLPVDTSHYSYSADELKSAGFAPSAIRLSVGLESFEELQADVAQALGDS